MILRHLSPYQFVAVTLLAVPLTAFAAADSARDEQLHANTNDGSSCAVGGSLASVNRRPADTIVFGGRCVDGHGTPLVPE